MSYMALYRKWRPDEFQEVKGQEHIVTTLKNQIKHERIGHAYLFCGTRGTGKTTIAKLMAKAVNCENPVDGSPCNCCESCKSIANGSSMNVVEIDAASNNGVDNIRQINNAVQYSPQSGKYLVYIIDEVHMLSIGAFNALLKTLEEPPSYVIFILATTEAHKIPITILSRCQRYDFKRISIETISGRLKELLERENVAATEDALNYVARAADGSMRDALSILDQCIAFNLGEELTYDRVLETIGAVDVEVYIKLFEAIAASDTSVAIDIVDKAVWQGKDISQLIVEFTGFVRNVLMLKLDPEMTVDVSSDNIPKLIELGEGMKEAYLIEYINILQEAANKIGYTTTKRIMLEVAIIKMCKPQMQLGLAAMEKRIEQLEAELSAGGGKVVYVNSGEIPAGAAVMGQPSVNVSADSEELSEKVTNNIIEKYGEADAREIFQLTKAWDEFVSRAMNFSRNYLTNVTPVPGATPSSIDMVYPDVPENHMMTRYFSNADIMKSLSETISEMAGRQVKLVARPLKTKDFARAEIQEFDMSKINFKVEQKF